MGINGELEEKLGRVFAEMKGIDVVLLVNTENRDPNFLYLTGLESGVYEDDMLFVERNGITLLTSPLEYETASSQKVEGFRVVNARASADEFEKWLKRLFAGKSIGINGSFMTYSMYNKLLGYGAKAIADVGAQLLNARQVKIEKEVKAIKKAALITKFAMIEIQKYFKAGITEQQLAARFDYILASLGSQGNAFDTIVCFGKNSAYPHHMPDSTQLVPGDFVLIDAGAKVNNYCGDITRTFIFEKEKAKDYERMVEVYNTVKQAQLRAIHAIRPGKTGAEIHNIASNYINRAHKGIYKGRFTHSLGHAVGIEVHDGPGFSPSAKQVLKENMVITAEPGIYIKGFGGVRIEDDILITKDGAVVL